MSQLSETEREQFSSLLERHDVADLLEAAADIAEGKNWEMQQRLQSPECRPEQLRQQVLKHMNSWYWRANDAYKALPFMQNKTVSLTKSLPAAPQQLALPF